VDMHRDERAVDVALVILSVGAQRRSRRIAPQVKPEERSFEYAHCVRYAQDDRGL
jgi:hypothetical protein